jgi:hypothetical protein
MHGASPYERRLIAQRLEPTRSSVGPGTVVILVPQTAPSQFILEAAIWPAMANCGFERSDVLAFDSDTWIDDIGRWIAGAELIVADLTGVNADVMYILGLAHGLGRCPLLICPEGDGLPFGLRSFRCVYYQNTSRDLQRLRHNLTRATRVFLAAADASRGESS